LKLWSRDPEYVYTQPRKEHDYDKQASSNHLAKRPCVDGWVYNQARTSAAMKMDVKIEKVACSTLEYIRLAASFVIDILATAEEPAALMKPFWTSRCSLICTLRIENRAWLKKCYYAERYSIVSHTAKNFMPQQTQDA
jgi:hypothetical protein